MTDAPEEFRHQPVMPQEALELLSLAPGKTAVDATLGGGGHAERMLEALSPGGRLVGIDIDPEALAWSRRRLEQRAAGLEVTLHLVQANFGDLGTVLDELGLGPVEGLLADLGVSFHQLTTKERGFGFSEADAPLDMRMDATSGQTAADLVNRLPERELADVIFRYGEERYSRRIARRIVAERERGRLETTGQLARVVAGAVLSGRKGARRERIHPATRTFQALRMAVNDETGSLARLLNQLPERVASGGRAVIISFHSLEDRPVKEFLREQSQRTEVRLPTFRLLTPRPLRPSAAEASLNPRARSARLRAAERI